MLTPSVGLWEGPLFQCASTKLVSAAVWHERERELRKEGRVVPSRVKLREGPINVTELHSAKPTMGLR
jgi:hypothetical protein